MLVDNLCSFVSICKLDIKSLTFKYVLFKVYVSVLLVIPWCWFYYIWKRFIYITNETILAFVVFIEFERNGSKN